MNTEERRISPRIKLRQLAQVSQEDSATGMRNEIMGSTGDISEHGVRIEADQGFQAGAEVLISFAVGEKIVEAKGQVVHFTAKPDGMASMGIKFTDLPEDDQKFIETYCRTKSPKPSA